MVKVHNFLCPMLLYARDLNQSNVPLSILPGKATHKLFFSLVWGSIKWLGKWLERTARPSRSCDHHYFSLVSKLYKRMLSCIFLAKCYGGSINEGTSSIILLARLLHMTLHEIIWVHRPYEYLLSKLKFLLVTTSNFVFSTYVEIYDASCGTSCT